MDLSTPHKRAQAIADGGTAAELARVVEVALETHSSDREADCWEALNGIHVEVFDQEDFQKKVDLLYRQMLRNHAVPHLVKADLEEFAETLSRRLAKAGKQIEEAMEILNRP